MTRIVVAKKVWDLESASAVTCTRCCAPLYVDSCHDSSCCEATHVELLNPRNGVQNSMVPGVWNRRWVVLSSRNLYLFEERAVNFGSTTVRT